MESQGEEASSSNQTIQMFIEYKLIREFVSFQKQNLSHICIVPSYETPYRWNGVMFIHHGLYTDAILKFFVDIPENYPTSECPKITFDPIPFHPLIDPKTGVLNTSREFPTWRPNINQIWHVIVYARMIFHNLEKEVENRFKMLDSGYEEQLNDPLVNPIESTPISKYAPIQLGDHYENAMQLYRDNFSQFQAKIEETIKECHSKLYDFEDDNDRDLHAIKFGPWDPKEHEILRNKLRRGVDITEVFEELSLGMNNNHKSGLTWVEKGNIFSKPSSK